LRRGALRIPRASYSRSALRLRPLRAATSPMNSPLPAMRGSIALTPRGKVKGALYGVELPSTSSTWEGAWTRAQLVASQPPLSSSATSFLFRATLPTLSPGLHILYAYATNRQEASSIQTGGQSSPLIGNIAAHLVIALDCSSPHQIGAGTHIGNVIGPGQGPSLSVCRGH